MATTVCGCVSDARLTGRVRGENNMPIARLTVRLLVGRRAAATATTTPEGRFEATIVLGNGKVSKAQSMKLQVLDSSGSVVISESLGVRTIREGSALDVQVKLQTRREDEQWRGPDLHSDRNFERILKDYRGLLGRLDPSDEDAASASVGLEALVGNWHEDRRSLEAAGADEVTQVPRRPRRTRHAHISVWEGVSLPN